MKKFIIILLLLFFGSLGANYYYQHNFVKKIELPNLIPSDAILVYSSTDIGSDYLSFLTTELGVNLLNYNWFNSIKKDFDVILNHLNEKTFSSIISIHKSSKNDLLPVYYFDYNEKNKLQGLLDIYKVKDKLKIDDRVLDGIQITELIKNKRTVLCYAKIDDWIVVTPSPFIIEKIIKNLDFEIEYERQNKVVSVNLDNFNSYFNSNFNKNFINEFLKIDKEIVNFKLSNKGVFHFVNGVGKLNSSSKNKVNINLIQASNYITMNTAIVCQDGNNLKGLIGNSMYWISNDKSLIKNVVDTLFVNNSRPIYNIKKSYNNKEFSFGVLVNDYVIISESKSLLNEVINDIDNENVWSKSIKIRNQLSNTVNDTKFSLVVNWEKASNYISENAKRENSIINHNMDWIDFIVYQSSFSNENIIVESFISVKKNEITTININENLEEKVKPNQDELIYEHENKIITQPKIVKNHNTGGREIVFQDSKFNVCLMSSSREMLWKTNVKSKLVSNIHQIDIFRNGKLQYVFSTETELIILDRNGNLVENYPIKIEGGITHLSLFDYNHDNNYRFLLTLSNGNMFLFDAKGKKLNPWNPLRLNSSVIESPQHVRINTKDYIVTVTKDNKTHVFNRRGEYYEGFPLDIGIENSVKFKININSNSTNSSILVYSSDGKLGKINFKGELIEKSKDLSGGKNITLYGNGNDIFYTYVKNHNIEICNSINDNKFTIEMIPDRLSIVDLNAKEKLLSINTANNTELYTTNGKLISNFKSSEKESYIYSEAKEELIIYFINDNKILKMKLSI